MIFTPFFPPSIEGISARHAKLINDFYVIEMIETER